MGFVFKFLDKKDLFATRVYTYTDMTPEIKRSMRLTILLFNAILYYPTVIFIVKKTFPTMKQSFKLLLMILLLNIPTYAISEHSFAHLNTLSFSLLLWTLYFIMNEWVFFGSLCYTLLVCTANRTAVFGILFIAYILVFSWKKGRLQCCIVSLVKIAVSVVVTVFVSIIPFYHMPKSLEVIKQIFKTFVTPDPVLSNSTIWKLLIQSIGYNNPVTYTDQHVLIELAITGFILFLMFSRNSSKENFLNSFILFSIVAELIGVFPDIDALSFVMLALLIQPQIYKNVFFFFMIVSLWRIVPISASVSSPKACLIISALNLLVGYVFEWHLTNTEEVLPQCEDNPQSWLEKTIGNILATTRAERFHIKLVLIGLMTSVCGTYVNCKYNFLCTQEHLVMLQDMTYCFCCVALIFFWFYCWTLLCSTMFTKVEKGKIQEKVPEKIQEKAKAD